MTTEPTAQALQWARQNVCVRRLDDVRVVRVVGDDARSWLNGQTTSDVREARSDAAVYTLSVDVKGRIQADLWVVAEDDGLSFVAPRQATEPLLAAMDRYIIMEDVELLPDPDVAVITVQGPAAAALLDGQPASRRYSAQRLGVGGFDLWVELAEADEVLDALGARARAAGGGIADAQGWADAHVAAGIPRFGPDFGSHTYPQEAGLKDRAVAFDKGCYLGQEVVCMLENRGKLARRLMVLDGPEGALAEPGAACLRADDTKVGQITSFAAVTPPRALAFLKRGADEEGGSVRVSGVEWTVARAASAAAEVAGAGQDGNTSP